MRCIFCKKSSDASRSVEHIIPESLGGTLHTLPPGVVCDGCNNYFARKVEEPFLASGQIRYLRSTQSIPRKNGRLLPLEGVLMPGHPVTLHLPPHGVAGMPILEIESPGGDRALFNRILGRGGGSPRLVFPWAFDPPDETIVSRLLAKMGLEAVAKRGLDIGLCTDYVAEESQFDPIRNHARSGDRRVRWPYSIRRIYDENKCWIDEDGSPVQRANEYDFLVTDDLEYFFVVAIFGVELAINMGGPDIESYHQWVRAHGGVSPLYWGKNSGPESP